MRQHRQQIINEIPQLTASRIFGRYKEETQKTVRKVEVVEDRTLEKLVKIWKKFDRYKNEGPAHRRLLKALEKIDYSAADVGKFAAILSEFDTDEKVKPFRESVFGKKTGLILSALTDKGDRDNFTISLRHLRISPDYLGFQNRKNLIINGDVNYLLGFQMVAGRIIVNGNAGYCVGSDMEGGEIIIKGNVMGIGEHGGYRPGFQSGKIVVEGNVGEISTLRNDAVIIVGGHVGNIHVSVFGGEIHLNGTYDRISLPPRSKTRIFHKGKLIFGK